MSRRSGLVIASIAALALIALPACPKKKKGAGTGTGTAAAAKGTGTAAAGTGAAAKGTGTAAAGTGTAAAGTGSAAAGGNDATFEAAMKLNEKIADAAEANKADCKKMAAAIIKIFNDNKALIAKARDMRKSMTPEQMKAMAAKQMERAKKYAPKMMHLGKCAAKNKDLMNAMKGLK